MQVLVTQGSAQAAACPAACVSWLTSLTNGGTTRGTLTGVLGSEWTLAYPLLPGLDNWGGAAQLTDKPKAQAVASMLLTEANWLLGMGSTAGTGQPRTPHPVLLGP
jgi:hypothetical protein